MSKIKLAKLLDILSYILMIAIIGYYVFFRPSIEIVLTALLAIAIIRMVSSNLKAAYYRGFYQNLKDENDILHEKVARLEYERLKNNNK